MPEFDTVKYLISPFVEEFVAKNMDENNLEKSIDLLALYFNLKLDEALKELTYKQNNKNIF